MSNTIADSLAKIRLIESTEVLNESAAAPVAQAAGKGIGRFIPGVGAALGAYDAYGRAKQGDWTGAGLSALGGAASLIPGIGTAASLGIAGAQALRDKQRTGSYMPGDDEIAGAVAKDKAAQPVATAPAAAPSPAGADPKVLALQKQLIAKGAKITADGKMGPQTQAAMKQFPGVAVAEQNKGNDMSESQRIAELRDRLAQLESQPQIADEGIADLAKGAWQGMKNIGSAFKAGVADPAGAKALAPAATKAGEKTALKTGAAVARNPGKVAAGSAAAGAAGMAALAGGAANKPADPTGNKPPAASGGPAAPAAAPAADTAAAPAASSLTTDEEGEMGVLAQELGPQMGRLPELDALLLQYEKLRPGAINAAP
jgi:hypothetical protein